MAVQIDVQRGPLAGTRPLEIGRPVARPNLAPSDARPTSTSSLRRSAIHRRRLARRVRMAGELSVWLGGSVFLTLIVVGGLAGLH